MDSDSKLEELIKMLAHKIRTPLSIIQNELSCIEDKLETEEYQRILSACKNINLILKENPQDLLKLTDEKND